MELHWLECILYGLVSGITEFLPVSALAHQTVLLKLSGLANEDWMRFSAHLGALAALLTVFTPAIQHLLREQRLRRIPKNRRRRQPDFAAVTEMRVLRSASVMIVLLFLGYRFVESLHERLWVLAFLIGLNGVLLYVPQFLPGANKTAQSMSGLDSTLIGIAAGMGVIPGISAVGAGASVARMRGVDRRYAIDLSLMLCIPGIALVMIPELIGAVTAGIAVTGALILSCAAVAGAAFLSGYWGVVLMRFMAVKVGYAAFAYYCWGLALFTLILYLI